MIDKVSRIMEAIEIMLDKHDVTIPSEDREGEPDEARLFGSEYYKLEDKISRILNS